jgi:RNA polymerase sigma factor (TIGR02999 family)
MFRQGYSGAMAEHSENVTELLLRLGGSGPEALDLLFERLYDELRAIAARRLQSERDGHTLSATALVNEAYLKLADLDRLTWKNRAQFFAIAARAMRRILVNHAREQRAGKRGGEARVITLQAGMADEPALAEFSWSDVITVDRALEDLEKLSERQARVMELHLFAGLTHEEVAGILEVSVPTVRRDWRLGRAFLARALT